MKLKEIKVKNLESSYSIIIGKNTLNILPKKINKLCPKAKNICLVIDKNIPKKYKTALKIILKRFKIFSIEVNPNEKFKSIVNVNKLVEFCLKNNFNRSDVLIAFGGGIVGDYSGFAASLIKRGINFINVPTTLLSQVDSSVGGKTGVNSKYGKNLIGTFYQPKLVVSDIELLKSLPKREIVCGYAEILKHSIILEGSFFNWLKLNSRKILKDKDLNLIQLAIYKSCKIKLHFVNNDVTEKNKRMTLNFGHTFAHAIEAKNKFNKRINHGEAVLMGMMIATKLSLKKGLASKNTLDQIRKVYESNQLNYDLNKFFKKKEHPEIIKYMSNDKKNYDKKINLILLKKIGKTTTPGKIKLTMREIIKEFPNII